MKGSEGHRGLAGSAGAPLLLLPVLFGLVGCTPSVEERLAWQRPIHGPSQINYVLGSDGRIVLEDAADVAQTIGRYRRLDYTEAEKLRALAQEEFDGFIAREIEQIRKSTEYGRKKAKIEERARERKRREPTASAEIEQEATREVEELEAEARSRALISLRRRYGSQIAIRVRTNDQKPAVAIAEVRDSTVVRPPGLVELDRPPGAVVEHKGKPTAVVDGGSESP